MTNKHLYIIIATIAITLVGAGCNNKIVKKNLVLESKQKEVTQITTQPAILQNTQITDQNTPNLTTTTLKSTTVNCKYDEQCFIKHLTDCSSASYVDRILTLRFSYKIIDKGQKCSIHFVANGFAELDKLSNNTSSPTAKIDNTYVDCEFDKTMIKDLLNKNPNLEFTLIRKEIEKQKCSGTYMDLLK